MMVICNVIDIVGYDRRISVLPSAPPLDTEFHKNITPTYSYSYSRIHVQTLKSTWRTAHSYPVLKEI